LLPVQTENTFLASPDSCLDCLGKLTQRNHVLPELNMTTCLRLNVNSGDSEGTLYGAFAFGSS
jgi:hypothetical protein